MSDVIIRNATLEDFVGANFDIVHSSLVKTKYLALVFSPQSKEEDLKTWHQMMKDPLHIVYGAFTIPENEWIGHCSLRLKSKRNRSRHVADWGIIVRDEWRGKGIATRILTYMEDQARSMNGITKLSSSFVLENEAAKHLYVDKLGYEVEGIQKQAIRLDDGQIVDLVMLGKFM